MSCLSRSIEAYLVEAATECNASKSSATCFAVIVVNIFLLFFLNARDANRRKFILYSFVAFGDIGDGTYLLYGGFRRIQEMSLGIYYYSSSMWACTSKHYLLPRICGQELVALCMLCMSMERLIAVFWTLFYRAHFTNNVRILMGIGSLIFVVLNYGVLLITSSMDTRTDFAPDRYCGISLAAPETFQLWHQYLNIACQVAAFITCAVAYSAAWYKARSLPNIRKEMQTVKPILASSFVSCVLITANNKVFLLRHFSEYPISRDVQNIVVTYSPAVFQLSKFFLYIGTGRQFREALVDIVYSDGVDSSVVLVSQKFSTSKASGIWKP